MSMTKIKLCGNFRAEDADLLNLVQPDMAGMIFVPNQRRTVNIQAALAIRARLDSNIPLFGVFKNQNIDDILSIFETDMIQGVQLHGDESELDVELLQKKDIPVIKVRTPEQALLPTSANYLLLDESAGSGKVFDWRMVPPKSLRQQPLILAGGLTPANLQAIIDQTHPDVVDISSGDETNGIKNLDKMRTLVQIAHKNV